MSNEYKEWLKEQTFESLANDNLRIKLELKTAKEENEKLRKELDDEKYEFQCARNRYIDLTQQNKQMGENINNIKNLCNEDWEDMTVDKFQNQLLQALKGGE